MDEALSRAVEEVLERQLAFRIAMRIALEELPATSMAFRAIREFLDAMDTLTETARPGQRKDW